MQFPERFSDLPEYAFPRLRSLLDPYAAGGDVLHLSLGEPKNPFPDWVSAIIARESAGFGRYPANDGSPDLLEAISGWLARRYGVQVDPGSRIMALNGTREGLFSAAVALFPERKAGQRPAVLIPNPFYPVYAVGTVTAGAEPVFVDAGPDTGFLPDFAAVPADVLARTVAVYVCSPSNPQGAVASAGYWASLLALAERHDFRILADECYAEIYRGDPPVGVLQAASAAGADPERVVAFHSLSKRSNLPGLRSGFVAGGPQTIAAIKRLRAYAGAPLPGPLQAAAAAVWRDEAHVTENRASYARRFAMADQIIGGVEGWSSPPGGFFLWLPVDDGETACVKLWRETGVRVLPGAYLARDTGGTNPGKRNIRVALVAPDDDVRRGLTALVACLKDAR